MLRLGNNDPRPVAITLAAGAVVYARRATTFDYHAASAAAAASLDAIRRGEEALLAAEFEVPSLLEDPFTARGVTRYLFAVELGVRCITGWDGIGNEEGEAVAPSRAAILALMRDPDTEQAIVNAILARVHQAAQEGNGSAASPNGADGAASPIAEPAAKTASPAPGAGAAQTDSAARRSSTRR